MSYLSIIIALFIGVLSLTYVLYPLYKHVGSSLFAPAAGDPESTVPTEGEMAARLSLQEVELDYQLGNLSEHDYGSLRERYLNRALLALKSRHEREKELDLAIEEQLRLLKEQGKEEGNEDSIE